MTTLHWIAAFFSLFLLFFSGFFSGMETGVVSVSRAKIRNLSDKGNRRAQTIAQFLEHPDHIISTVLVGNNICNVALSVSTTWIFVTLFADQSKAVIATMLTVTPTILIFGEILPKTLFRQRPHQMTLAAAPYFALVHRVLERPSRMILKSIHYVLPQRPQDALMDTLLRRQEIQALVREGERRGVLEDEEKAMIESVFELHETAVEEVMVPRVAMKAISSELPYDELIQKVIAEPLTRFPVYSETPDTILGFLHVSDILKAQEDWIQSIDPPFYLPESARVDDALESLRREGRHMAIVVDEYGGTAGLVTIEDLLEELVGEIEDEFDEDAMQIVEFSPSHWSVNGATDLDELEERFNFKVSDEIESETIGGMVTELLGRIPRPGEKVINGRHVVEVTSADERHVIAVEIKETKRPKK